MKMTIEEIVKILDCTKLTRDEDLFVRDISLCFASDLMSDVLRFGKAETLLLTGITNNQVLQVAEIMDLKGIVFVRGKKPDENIIKKAEERKLPLLTTNKSLFDTCGILYQNGLREGVKI